MYIHIHMHEEKHIYIYTVYSSTTGLSVLKEYYSRNLNLKNNPIPSFFSFSPPHDGWIISPCLFNLSHDTRVLTAVVGPQTSLQEANIYLTKTKVLLLQRRRFYIAQLHIQLSVSSETLFSLWYYSGEIWGFNRAPSEVRLVSELLFVSR